MSMLGSDMVLTIGLPLVSGMTLRQLTGVLAHEFGHFAQGSGMRVTYVIRSVNAWFARVVYERDAWDQKLADWSAQAGRELVLVMWACQLLVWLARRVLWALMWAGHFVSCFMLRQMEYDADRYEARVAGSETFAQTADRLLVLSLASQGAHSDLVQSWQTNRLADDLPRLILENVGELQQAHSAVLAAARESSARETTKAFATHPANRDRIASAARERAPGLFQIEAPATVLFHDYDRIAREVTLAFYKNVIGPEVEPKNLIPTARLVAEQADRLEGHKAAATVSAGRRLQRVPPVPRGRSTSRNRSSRRKPKTNFCAARTRMLEALPRYQEALTAFLEADRESRQSGDRRDADGRGNPGRRERPEVERGGPCGGKAGKRGARCGPRRAAPGTRRGGTTDRRPHAVGVSAPVRARNRRAGRRGVTAPPHTAASYSIARESLHRAWPHIENLRLKMALLGTLFNDLSNNKENTSLVTQIKSIASQIMVLLARHARPLWTPRPTPTNMAAERSASARISFRRFLDRRNSPSFSAPRRAWSPSTTHSTTGC